MAKGVDMIAHHTFTTERPPQATQNYRTNSLISHPSKVIMLQVILN